MAIVTDVFLLAMGRVLGVIKIEHDELGGALIRGDKLLEEHLRHAVEFHA